MTMKSNTSMGGRRNAAGYKNALEFAKLLRVECPEMTESRLFRIETERTVATPAEKAAIARLLGCQTWELCI